MHLKFWFSITFAFSNLVKKQEHFFGLFAKDVSSKSHSSKKSKNYIYKLIKKYSSTYLYRVIGIRPLNDRTKVLSNLVYGWSKQSFV